MLKAGTPVVVMVMLSLSGVEHMSVKVGMSTLLMAFGTGITSLGEVNWHTLGFCLMLLSEIAEAGRCVITQHILKVCKYLVSGARLWLLINKCAPRSTLTQNLKFSVLESQYFLAPGVTRLPNRVVPIAVDSALSASHRAVPCQTHDVPLQQARSAYSRWRSFLSSRTSSARRRLWKFLHIPYSSWPPGRWASSSILHRSG